MPTYTDMTNSLQDSLTVHFFPSFMGCGVRPLHPATIADWCNGSTTGFDPVGGGSSPSLAAKQAHMVCGMTQRY